NRLYMPFIANHARLPVFPVPVIRPYLVIIPLTVHIYLLLHPQPLHDIAAEEQQVVDKGRRDGCHKIPCAKADGYNQLVYRKGNLQQPQVLDLYGQEEEEKEFLFRKQGGKRQEQGQVQVESGNSRRD